jgi:tetratricopeptide (TPR) repeat protein
MAIRGSLHEASLPDVLQLLYLGRRSGCLSLSSRRRHATVYLEDGWVVHAAIVNRPDRLGDMLVKSGRITPAQLDQAIAMQNMGHGRRVGELLVALGAITPEELSAVIRRQVEEAVYALFSWETGTFSFEPGVRPDETVERVRIPTDALLLEGARRVDEWSLIAKKIPSFDLIFALDPSQASTGEPDYSETQRRLLPLLDGVRDVRALIDESGLTEFEVSQALYGLITAGLAQRVGTSAPRPEGRSLESQIAEHRNLGVAFYRAGMLEEAVREFRRVTELRPSEGAAPFYLGLIAVREGRWSDAVHFFRRALDRAGPRPAILHNLGVALGRAGEREQEEVLLADAAGRAPAHPQIQLSWGLAALERGDWGVAVVRLEHARELFGDWRPALWYWAMARALALSGDLEAALAVAAEGASVHPNDGVLLNNHAVLLEAAGEFSRAHELLQQALEVSPSLAQVSKNLGDVLYRLGRYEEATEAFERAAGLRPDLSDDLYFKLGNLALKRGDAASARSHWSRVLDLNPRHQLARANLQMLGTGT